MSDIDLIRKYPDKCCVDVTRKGKSQPCDKIAVAVMNGRDSYEDEDIWWPVCAYHARGQAMVPLADLINELEPRPYHNPELANGYPPRHIQGP